MKIIKNALKMRNSSTTEFEAINGFVGESGVHVGPEMPLGSGVDLWINPTNTDTYTVVEMDDLNKAINYSIEEMLTGGTWIDGKPIYRAVRRIDSLVSGQNLTTAFTDSPISDIVSIRGVIYGNSIYVLPFLSPTTLENGVGMTIVDYKTNEPKVNVNMGSGMIGNSAPNGTALVIVEYTKTTD